MKPSRKIPDREKKALLLEAGGKCANPGCPATRVEHHHIKEWAVVKSHNKKDMIAICPTCHDAAHYGTLKITEKTLYQWKNIAREPKAIYGNIFVEPGAVSKVILGSIALAQRKPSRSIVFSLSKSQFLEFEVLDNFLSVSTQISAPSGKTLIKVTNNNITDNSEGLLTVETRPGRFRVTAPTNTYLLPAYAILKMRKLDPQFANSDSITVLDIQVTKPGHVKIEGFWNYGDSAMIVTEDMLTMLHAHSDYPTRMAGEGENSVIVYVGPIDEALFRMN
ncbi:HNH endonuclease signature motif containing protein [Pseudomonas vranovensis]|uniref:HNH endonuclease signature motif containing protein n=1 Tax=Pseudomonas vranovensis TaxID=321661 RepID=UPI003D9819B1